MQYARDATTQDILDASMLSSVSFSGHFPPIPECIVCHAPLFFHRATSIKGYNRNDRNVAPSFREAYFSHPKNATCQLMERKKGEYFEIVAQQILQDIATTAHLQYMTFQERGRTVLRFGNMVGLEFPATEPSLVEMSQVSRFYWELKEKIYPLWIWPIHALGKNLTTLKDIEKRDYHSSWYQGIWKTVALTSLGVQESPIPANKVMVVDRAGEIACVAVNHYSHKTDGYQLYIVKKNFIPPMRCDEFHDERNRVLGTMLRPIEKNRPWEQYGTCIKIHAGSWRYFSSSSNLDS